MAKRRASGRPETGKIAVFPHARAPLGALALAFLVAACDRPPVSHGLASSSATPPAPPSSAPPANAFAKVELQQKAMGTSVHLIAFASANVDATATKRALDRAYEEMLRLEKVLSEWRPDSEVSAINQGAGKPVSVGADTFAVIDKSLWAGSISEGSFDITFQSMSELWRFGDAAEERPKVPSAAEVAAKKKLVDYRKLKLDAKSRSVTVPPGVRIGLGGIAKGYIVDRAAALLHSIGLRDFLVQAGGDLYGAGRKPDGAPWVSGIQDPRGPQGRYFAMIELENHAFSTAGDYARSYIVDGKRYHHIIDPHTGYPATPCRSVTVWAPDAFIADAIDDGIFILGPEKGLKLVESIEGAGAVIVDAKNQVLISERLKGKVKILSPPTGGI
jgi:FAD:protein FMN transferase